MDRRKQQILELLYQHDEGLGFRDIMKIVDISQATVHKYLRNLIEDKYVEVSNSKEWSKGKKKVHVITEKGRKILEKEFHSLLKELRNEINNIFSVMPVQWPEDASMKGLIHDVRLRHETTHEINKNLVKATFIKDIHKMLLPKQLKNLDVYVGAFRNGKNVVLDIIPKQFVEELKESRTLAKKRI